MNNELPRLGRNVLTNPVVRTTEIFGFEALGGLCTCYGIPNEGAHGALRDAEMLVEIYLRYCQSRSQQGKHTTDDDGVAKTPAERREMEKPTQIPSPTRADEPQGHVLQAQACGFEEQLEKHSQPS